LKYLDYVKEKGFTDAYLIDSSATDKVVIPGLQLI